jgi:hypothetical protein
MDYHLVCVHPFGKYTKGQMVTDEAEVTTLLDDREHHFVRIAAPQEAAPEAPAEAPPSKRPILPSS